MRRFPLARLALPLAALAMIWATPATAETRQDEQAWINVTAMGAVKDDLVYFAEVQPRVSDGASRLDQLIVRGALGWKLSPSVTLYQGYGHIVTSVDGGRDINEERSFQQLNLALGKVAGGDLTSRTRLEQRWRSDAPGTGWRLREMLRYEKPLKPQSDAVNALVSTEVFFALNDTDWGARGGFDQVRTFVGAEIGLAGASTIEAGYLNQIIDQSGGRTRINHAVSLSLFLRP